MKTLRVNFCVALCVVFFSAATVGATAARAANPYKGEADCLHFLNNASQRFLSTLAIPVSVQNDSAALKKVLAEKLPEAAKQLPLSIRIQIAVEAKKGNKLALMSADYLKKASASKTPVPAPPELVDAAAEWIAVGEAGPQILDQKVNRIVILERNGTALSFDPGLDVKGPRSDVAFEVKTPTNAYPFKGSLSIFKDGSQQRGAFPERDGAKLPTVNASEIADDQTREQVNSEIARRLSNAAVGVYGNAKATEALGAGMPETGDNDDFFTAESFQDAVKACLDAIPAANAKARAQLTAAQKLSAPALTEENGGAKSPVPKH